MAENKTPNTASITPARQSGEYVRAAAPVNTDNLKNLKMAKSATPTENVSANPGNSKELKMEEKTEGKKFSNAQEELLYLNEANKNGLLTLEQQARREELQNREDAEALTDQRNDDNVRAEDPDKDKFAEMDVIKYLYEKWLIELAEWCAQKAEKKLNQAIEKGYRRTLRHIDKQRAEKNAYQSGTTFKTAEKIDEKMDAEKKKIKSAAKDEISFLPRISTKIGDGTLFDRDENGQYGAEAKKFAEHIGAIDKDGNIDTDHEAWKRLQDKFAKKESLRYGGSDKEYKKACADLRGLGAKIQVALTRKIDYDSQRQIAALGLTGAQMLHEVAADAKAFDGKNLDTIFANKLQQNNVDLAEKTKDERQAAMLSPIKGLGIFAKENLTEMGEEAQKMGLGKKTMRSLMDLQFVKIYGGQEELMSLTYMADNAFRREQDGIRHQQVAEKGKKPLSNRALNKLQKTLGYNDVEQPAEIAKAPSETERTQDLRSAVVESNNRLSNNQEKIQELEGRMADNNTRLMQHNASPLARRIEEMKKNMPAFVRQNNQKDNNLVIQPDKLHLDINAIKRRQDAMQH